MLQHHPRDANRASKPLIEEVKEDLRRRMKRAVDGASQAFLHIRVEVTFLQVFLPFHRIWSKSGIDSAGIMDVEPQAEHRWI